MMMSVDNERGEERVRLTLVRWVYIIQQRYRAWTQPSSTPAILSGSCCSQDGAMAAKIYLCKMFKRSLTVGVAYHISFIQSYFGCDETSLEDLGAASCKLVNFVDHKVQSPLEVLGKFFQSNSEE